MIDFKGAIFDLDGTLFDSMWVWQGVDIDFLGRRGIEVPDDYVKIITPMGAYATAEYTIQRFNLKESPQDLINEWTSLAIDAYKTKVALKPGARKYLIKLKNRGIRLSVATASAPELYVPALKNNGVYDLFDAFTHSGEVTRAKGFPDIYLLAADKIGLKNTDCVVFEDIYDGICGAKAGGFYVVGIKDSFSKGDEEKIIKTADKYIHSFEELLD